MKSIMALAVTVAMLVAVAAPADTIYSWTDEQGVQRFSSDPPPEGIENFQKLEFDASSSPRQGADEERRSSYDRMVREASEEARQLEQQREAQAEARAAEKRRLAENLRKEKIANERTQLELQIEAIKKRALGPTYTQGMKQAQIDKIKKRIDALESNPDAAKPQQEQSPSESNSGY